jgi:exonuclease III
MGHWKSTEKNTEVTATELTCREQIILYIDQPSGVNRFFFFTNLTEILEQLVQKDRYIILVGDISINIRDVECSQKQLFEGTNTSNLTVTINIPTRVTECMATIIDQINTNKPSKCFYSEVINSLH